MQICTKRTVDRAAVADLLGRADGVLGRIDRILPTVGWVWETWHGWTLAQLVGEGMPPFRGKRRESEGPGTKRDVVNAPLSDLEGRGGTATHLPAWNPIHVDRLGGGGKKNLGSWWARVGGREGSDGVWPWKTRHGIHRHEDGTDRRMET